MNSLGPQVTQNSRLRRLPKPAKRALNALYWMDYDALDYVVELIGRLPSHRVRLFLCSNAFTLARAIQSYQAGGIGSGSTG